MAGASRCGCHDNLGLGGDGLGWCGFEEEQGFRLFQGSRPGGWIAGAEKKNLEGGRREKNQKKKKGKRFRNSEGNGVV